MDRDWLAHELERGRSIGEIARQVGRHPATVGYWVNKHRLVSRHAARHAARGGIDEARLRSFVERGFSIREIAAECDLSPGTVRHWLRRFGLQTQPARYAPRGSRHELVRECRVHGWATFRRVGSGSYRCSKCGPANVARRRRRVKEILLAEAGGACRLCGYDRFPGALQFHHVERAEKRFQIAARGVTRSLVEAREEARKCVLLCANCHAEVEGGLRRLPKASRVEH
jgi:transposase-like protein/DNA-directed RNA polymerase subunit RPC12/RpoP